MAAGAKLMEKKDYRRAVLEFKNALKFGPRDPDIYYQIGVADLGALDFVEAVSSFKKAIELNPNHAGAQLKLAQLLASTSEPNLLDEAKSRIAALLSSNPNNADALNTLALTDLRLGKIQEGMERLAQILQNDPSQTASAILLAEAMWGKRDLKGVEQVLKQAYEHHPSSPVPLIALARFYRGVNRLDDAEVQLRKAIAVAPQNCQAQANLGFLLVQEDRRKDAEVIFRQLSTADDADYKPLLAMFLFDQGRLAESVQEFERLAKTDPSDRLARTRLVAAYRAVGRGIDAQRVLGSALKKNPMDLDALLQESEFYIEAKNYNAAEADLYRILHLRPISGEAHFVLAKIRRLQGTPLTERQELSEAIRLSPYLLAARLQFAQLLMQAGDARVALQVLNEAPATQRKIPELLIQRNWVFWTTGDMAALRAGIDQGLSINRSSDLLIQDGLWKLRNGKNAEARAAIDDALKINPTDIRALSLLNKSYMSTGQTSTAIQKIKEYATQGQRSAPVQEYLGKLMVANGNLSEARTAFETALSIEPQFLPAQLSLAQLDAADKKWDSASARLSKVLVLDRGNAVAPLWLGNIEEMRGNHEQSIKHFRDAVARAPGNSQAMNNLAYVLGEYGNQPDEALKFAERAHELAPNNPEYADTLGWILYRKGLFTSALGYLKRAGSEDGNIVWKYHLAMAYAQTGDSARSRAILNVALKRNPNVPEAKLAEEILTKRALAAGQ